MEMQPQEIECTPDKEQLNQTWLGLRWRGPAERRATSHEPAKEGPMLATYVRGFQRIPAPHALVRYLQAQVVPGGKKKKAPKWKQPKCAPSVAWINTLHVQVII